MLARALAAALERRDLAAAHALLEQLQSSHPDDPNTRLMAGTLARLSGELARAYGILDPLHQQFPQAVPVAFQLANCAKDLGHAARATGLYRSVLDQRPGHADAAYNLGLCLLADQPDEAGRWFLHAARCAPDMPGAHQQAIDCAGVLARRGEQPAVSHLASPDNLQQSISVVCCSITPARLERLRTNLADHLDGSDWELIHIGDARSLCEGYNRGIDASRGDVVVLCHDDIRVHASDFRTRLLDHLGRFDLIGPAGSTACTGPAVFWSGPPHGHGWVTHVDQAGYRPSLSSGFGPVIENAQALDGLFLAARRDLFERLRFDEATFDGFHLYDLDFSYRAFRSGARLGITQDLLVEHRSRGDFDDAWRHYAARFIAKFPQLADDRAPRKTYLFETRVQDEDEVRMVYAWIHHWLGELSEPTSA